LTDEEKVKLVESFTPDTTIDDAARIVKATVDAKRTAQVLANIGKPIETNPPKVRPVCQVKRAEEILESIETMADAGQDSESFIFCKTVIEYIFGVAGVNNPFKS
jgi:hypothetical protein